MAKRKKRNRGGGVPFNPDVDTGTKRPVTARVAVGDVNDKFSDYPSNGLTPRRLVSLSKLMPLRSFLSLPVMVFAV